MFGIAAVIEVNRMHATHRILQDMSDSAALSGAYVARSDIAGREDVVRENIRFHQAYIPDLNLADNAIVNFDDTNEQVDVSVMIPRSYASFFGGILGQDDILVTAKSVVTYKTDNIDPISIVFALDVSGSMGNNAGSGGPKIEVLKQSVSLLFEQLENAAPSVTILEQSLRTGMSAYNTDLVAIGNMGWGSNHLSSSVNSLIAQGGTNSTPALQNAYDQLKNDRNIRDTNEVLHEYVIFMTDGDNNEIIADQQSANLCGQMRADNIEIYSVAFAAPEKGQLLLLDCASWNNGGPPNNSGPGNNGNGNNTDKCMNNGANGNGQALGHCKKKKDELLDGKSDYYFDADDADAFKSAFAEIGKEIAKSDLRISR